MLDIVILLIGSIMALVYIDQLDSSLALNGINTDAEWYKYKLLHGVALRSYFHSQLHYALHPDPLFVSRLHCRHA